MFILNIYESRLLQLFVYIITYNLYKHVYNEKKVIFIYEYNVLKYAVYSIKNKFND